MMVLVADESHHISSHAHGHPHPSPPTGLPTSSGAVRRLAASCILTALILLGEVAGGLWSGSLALLSDAGHVAMDLFALLLSLGALLIARRPANERLTFGWHRGEVFAAVINGISVLVVAGLILGEGIDRLLSPTPVKGYALLVIAAVGLAANAAVALTLKGHVGRDVNLKSAFLHVVGDAAASLAVIVGAVIVIITGWYAVDAILALAIGVLIIWGAVRVLRDALHILFEGVPAGIKPSGVATALAGVPHVYAVHDLHIWALCSHIVNLSAHLVVAPGMGESARSDCEALLRERFNISHTTLQVEETPCSQTVFCEKLQH